MSPASVWPAVTARLAKIRPTCTAWRSGALTSLVVPIRVFCRRLNGAWNRPSGGPRIAWRMLNGASVSVWRWHPEQPPAHRGPAGRSTSAVTVSLASPTGRLAGNVGGQDGPAISALISVRPMTCPGDAPAPIIDPDSPSARFSSA